MQTEVIVSGFGGQGVLFAGQLLAYAGMENGKEVTWIPAYGPEMRGGTANCTVIVSDDEIGSPFVLNPQGVIAMNLPSMDKYENAIATNGVLVVNTSMSNRKPTRKDIKVLLVPANEIAEELGNRRAVNMVLLGALMANLDVLPLAALEKTLAAHTSERMKKFLNENIEALRRGATFRPV